MADAYHVPVMVAEVVALLEPGRGGIYFDGTLGAGGHARALLDAGAAKVIGADRDPDALDRAAQSLASYGERLELRRGDFADVAAGLADPLAGALLDLGVSSHQIDEESRGFSFRPGVVLDMRMEGGEGGRTAADVLNTASEAELTDLFRTYGEERRAKRFASIAVRRRADRPFETSDDLVAVMQRALGGRITMQDRARIFQAVRIAVNDEMTSLEHALPVIRDRLDAGGVIVVIAYHSLEDRRVKDAFREWSRECVCPPELPICRCRGRALGETLTRKVVKPTDEEIAANPRSRSARLRAWRKAA